MATETTKTETTTAKRCLLPCPCCGENSACISLHLANATFTCGECETDFTIDHVREFIRKWGPVLKWVEQMPTGE